LLVKVCVLFVISAQWLLETNNKIRIITLKTLQKENWWSHPLKSGTASHEDNADGFFPNIIHVELLFKHTFLKHFYFQIYHNYFFVN